MLIKFFNVLRLLLCMRPIVYNTQLLPLCMYYLVYSGLQFPNEIFTHLLQQLIFFSCLGLLKFNSLALLTERSILNTILIRLPHWGAINMPQVVFPGRRLSYIVYLTTTTKKGSLSKFYVVKQSLQWQSFSPIHVLGMSGTWHLMADSPHSPHSPHVYSIWLLWWIRSCAFLWKTVPHSLHP